MRISRAVLALAAALAGGPSAAQLPSTYNVNRLPGDDRGVNVQIRRTTVRGTVKSVDVEKRLLVVFSGKGKSARDWPVSVGPCEIRAGKGKATLADAREGDRVSVYGETTVQGGLRAMEITLPAERMSIPPPSRPSKAGKEPPRNAPEKKS